MARGRESIEPVTGAACGPRAWSLKYCLSSQPGERAKRAEEGQLVEGASSDG